MAKVEAGWYPDPEDDQRLRYWDGDSWGQSKLRHKTAIVGESLRASGDRVTKVGISMLWITGAVGTLLLVGVLLVLLA